MRSGVSSSGLFWRVRRPLVRFKNDLRAFLLKILFWGTGLGRRFGFRSAVWGLIVSVDWSWLWGWEDNWVDRFFSFLETIFFIVELMFVSSAFQVGFLGGEGWVRSLDCRIWLRIFFFLVGMMWSMYGVRCCRMESRVFMFGSLGYLLDSSSGELEVVRRCRFLVGCGDAGWE